MSREKFEAWYESIDSVPGSLQDIFFFFWLAGRESMKSESEKACADIGPDAYKAFHAIHNIEP